MTQSKVKVLVSGCNGQMGQVLCRLIDESENFKVQYAFDKTAWELPNYHVCTSLEDIDETDLPDVIIDFSAPEATMKLLKFAKLYTIPIVIATTGFSKEQKMQICKDADWIPIFLSANMSFEVSLMKNVLEKIASKLAESDIEVVETHHNRKKDIPSGTALLLAKAIKDAFPEGEKEIVSRRIGKREKNEIGITSVRGGNIIGEHSVFFFGQNETFEIKHTAHSRNVFADGAIKAAEFLLEKDAPGLYTMDNLVRSVM